MTTTKRIYFDNSATTKISPEVLNAMMPYLTEEYGNPSSIHYMGDTATIAIHTARKQVAQSLNCRPSEIVFTSGGTESDNLAIIGSVLACKDPKKQRVVTTAIEHEAVLEACNELKIRGYKVTVLNVDKEGYLDPSILDDAMGDDVALVSVMAANNVVGTIEDISELAKVSHEHGSLFHTDAVQGYTKMKFDLKRDNIDLLALSGHKIHAPKGVGALYVKDGIQILPINFGGGQEKGLRSSTENVPGIVGLGKASEIAMSTMDEDIVSMSRLRDEIIDDMLSINGIHLNGPIGKKRLCNNVHFRIDGSKGSDIVIKLSKHGIAVSASSACSAGSSEPSYVLMSLGLTPEQCMSALRISLSRYNTEEEVVYFTEIMKILMS